MGADLFGGGGQTTTVSQPAYVQEAQENLLGYGQQLTSPFLEGVTPQYGVAGFTGDQLTAFDMFRGRAMSPIQGLNDPGVIASYQNPYTELVTEKALGRMGDIYDQNIGGIKARAAAGGAFGNRRDLLERGATEDYQRAAGDLAAQQYQSSFMNAQNTAMMDRSFINQAEQDRINSLLGIGGMQQNLGQRSIDMPFDMLQRLGHVTPGGSTQTTTTSGAGGGLGDFLLGAGQIGMAFI